MNVGLITTYNMLADMGAANRTSPSTRPFAQRSQPQSIVCDEARQLEDRHAAEPADPSLDSSGESSKKPFQEFADALREETVQASSRHDGSSEGHPPQPGKGQAKAEPATLATARPAPAESKPDLKAQPHTEVSKQDEITPGAGPTVAVAEILAQAVKSKASSTASPATLVPMATTKDESPRPAANPPPGSAGPVAADTPKVRTVGSIDTNVAKESGESLMPDLMAVVANPDKHRDGDPSLLSGQKLENQPVVVLDDPETGNSRPGTAVSRSIPMYVGKSLVVGQQDGGPVSGQADGDVSTKSLEQIVFNPDATRQTSGGSQPVETVPKDPGVYRGIESPQKASVLPESAPPGSPHVVPHNWSEAGQQFQKVSQDKSTDTGPTGHRAPQDPGAQMVRPGPDANTENQSVGTARSALPETMHIRRAEAHSPGDAGGTQVPHDAATQLHVSSGQAKDSGSMVSNNGASVATEQILAANNAQAPVSEPRSMPIDIGKPLGDASRSVGEQILESVQSRWTSGLGQDEVSRQVTVRLNPPELGRVSIRFEEDGGQLVGILEVNKQQTRYEIERALPQIVETLQTSGVQVRRLDVTLANEHEHQGFREQSFADGKSGFADQHESADNWQQSHLAAYPTQVPAGEGGYIGLPDSEEMVLTGDSINMLV